MNCYRCSTPIPDNSRYCLSCGALVSDPGEAGATTADLDDAAARDMERLLREATAGEYVVEREIGRGGMAIVYAATEVHLARKVAIKVLPPDLTFGRGTIERFKREARTAASLVHPNIIPIHRISPGGKLFWYAMQFVEGRSLADLLEEKKRMTIDEVVGVLKQVAEALDYAHERKVIHRDMKPANVMLDARGQVLVTDFGIAKQVTAGSLTSSGSILGTPYYMSPEQCTGSALTGAADQYSVGVMTYQMISGQLPFDGDSAVEILQMHCTRQPPPLEVLRPGLPRHVYNAVDRALAKKPGERFHSVSAFVEGLKKPPAPSTVTARVGSSRWHRFAATIDALPRRRKYWLLGAAAGVLATLAAGAALPWMGRAPLGQTAAQREASDKTAFAPSVLPADSSDGAIDRPTKPVGEAPATAIRKGPQSLVSSPPEAVKGHVAVTDVPTGAMVTVDGREMPGRGLELPAGQHEFRVVAPGFEPLVDTVIVTAGDSITHRFAARRVSQGRPVGIAYLTVGTQPLATIMINGQRLERNPVANFEVPSGSVRLSFEVTDSTGAWSYDTTVMALPGERRNLGKIILPRPGAVRSLPPSAGPKLRDVAFLTVGSRPLATIIINGRRLQSNPVVDFEVPTGPTHVRFEVTDSSGTWSNELTLSLRSGERRNLGRIALIRQQ